MSQNTRKSNRLNSENKEPAPQWFFASFTGDRSGSMRSINNAGAKGLCDWIGTMKETALKNNQQGFISVTTFDNEAKLVFDNVNTKSIKFTNTDALKEMQPRGTTRLYDTAVEDIDRLLSNVENFRNSLPKYVKEIDPNISVTWVCCTDGVDNASINNTRDDLREKVIYARSKGVKCFFIAANQDAIITGNSYGFSRDNSLSFSSNKQNADSAFRSVSENMRRVSSGSTQTQFTQSMRISSMSSNYTPTNVWTPSFIPLNQRPPPQKPYQTNKFSLRSA